MDKGINIRMFDSLILFWIICLFYDRIEIKVE